MPASVPIYAGALAEEEDGDVTGVGLTSINDEHLQAEEEEKGRRRQLAALGAEGVAQLPG